MRTDLFDYEFPRELIAQEPLEERDASRLMHIDRSRGAVTHHLFRDLPSLLEAGDLLVVNSTRVYPGRLRAAKEGTGGAVELLLLEPRGEGDWRVMTGGARLRPGTRLMVSEGLEAEVIDGPSGGRAMVRFTAGGRPASEEEVFREGSVPLPPYVRGPITEPERYQTVYCERELSAAAPTAGLHFTPDLLDELERRGVGRASIELAVGLDTFAPVRSSEIEGHQIHSEWFGVGPGCAAAVNDCAGRVVAVGTTTVRALETAAVEGRRRVEPAGGRTTLYITPGYDFRAVDALVTNFHFPRSTLLMLVCAFGGYDTVMDAYRLAVIERYRLFSFGDAMLIT